jgi:hypothetical protein
MMAASFFAPLFSRPSQLAWMWLLAAFSTSSLGMFAGKLMLNFTLPLKLTG